MGGLTTGQSRLASSNFKTGSGPINGNRVRRKGGGPVSMVVIRECWSLVDGLKGEPTPAGRNGRRRPDCEPRWRQRPSVVGPSLADDPERSRKQKTRQTSNGGVANLEPLSDAHDQRNSGAVWCAEGGWARARVEGSEPCGSTAVCAGAVTLGVGVLARVPRSVIFHARPVL
jgi:hypothetical protein